MPTTDDAGGTGVPPVGHRIKKEEDGRDGHATREGAIRIRQGACLPHWTREGGIYFVTFRLADSLPQSVIRAWQAERDEITRHAAQQGRQLTRAEQDRLQELFSGKVERYLDAGQGACWMNRPEIADLIAGALRHFDGQRYALLAWCIMPNHVHVVVQPFPGHELSAIQHSWKSFTAHAAVKKLNIPAPFWQPEAYDHLIRDDDDLTHAVEYTLDNPRAAGLEDWRWTGVKPDPGVWLLRDTGVPSSGGDHRRDVDATEGGSGKNGGTGVPPVGCRMKEEDDGRDGHATLEKTDAVD